MQRGEAFESLRTVRCRVNKCKKSSEVRFSFKFPELLVLINYGNPRKEIARVVNEIWLEHE